MAKRTRKPDMALIFKESVVQTIMSEFEQNKNWISSFDGDKAYVGLLFRASRIGGITKKMSSKNSDIGSFIEYVSNGRIKVLVTKDLILNEEFIIIPDLQTVKSMKEFSMLSDLEYELCYVTVTERIIITDTIMVFPDILKAVLDGVKASDLLSGEIGAQDFVATPSFMDDSDFVDATDVTEDEDDESNRTAREAVSQLFDASGEDVPESESVESDDESDEGFAFDAPTDVPDSVVDTRGFDISDSDDDIVQPEKHLVSEITDDESSWDDESDTDDDEDIEFIEVSDDHLNLTIARKFYSDALGLEISADAFAAHFLHNNEPVLFQEDHGAGWLNEQLRQMSILANTNIRKLHKDNLFLLQDKYFALISMASEEIRKKLDVENEASKYHAVYEDLIEQKHEHYKTVDDKTARLRAKLESDWNEKLAQVGEDAKNAAIVQYKERFGKQHDDDIYNVEGNIIQEIDSQFQGALNQLNDSRRTDASEFMDSYITDTLKVLQAEYLEMKQNEADQYAEFERIMSEFLDTNRKDEVARMQILENSLISKSEAEIVRNEYTAKIEAQAAEYAAKLDALAKENETLKKSIESASLVNDLDYASNIAAVVKANESLRGDIKELQRQIETEDTAKLRDWERRIIKAEETSDDWADKYERSMQVQRKTLIMFSCVIALILVIVVVVFSLMAIGSPADILSSDVVGSYHAMSVFELFDIVG